jgi:hypothetical protein
LGDVVGSGLNKGSDPGFSVVEEDLGGVFEARRGRVDWAATTAEPNRTMVSKAINRLNNSVDPIMADDCIRERVGFESSDQRLGKHPSDAERNRGVCLKPKEPPLTRSPQIQKSEGRA